MFYVFLAEGFEETEALAPVDVMRKMCIRDRFTATDFITSLRLVVGNALKTQQPHRSPIRE